MFYVQTFFNVSLKLKFFIAEVIVLKMGQRQAILTPCSNVRDTPEQGGKGDCQPAQSFLPICLFF